MEARWRRGRRTYAQRYAHEPGVYRRGWRSPRGPAWFVQVSVQGLLEYHGTFASYEEAVAVARAVRARRDAGRSEVAEVPRPIVAGRVEVPAEPVWGDGFGR